MNNDLSYKQQKKNKAINGLAMLVFFICMAPAAVFIYKKPHYNWDMLAYMALAVNRDHQDIQAVHTITYQSAKENIPAYEYGLLVQPAEGHRAQLAESDTLFYNNLSFYAVKPLYNLSVYAAYKAGIPLPRATILPGVLAFLLMGLALFHWMKKYLSLIFAFAASLLLMYSGFMIHTARISSPDTLSALTLFSAFYFMAESKSFIMTSLLLLLAVFIRMDNALTAILILGFLSFTGSKEKRLPLKWLLLMILLLGISYFIVSGMSGQFGWGGLFYPKFLHYLNEAGNYQQSFSLKTYLSLMYSKAITGMVFSHQTIFVLLTLLILVKPFPSRLKMLATEQALALLLPTIILVRFIFFPDISDRFYTAFYLFTAVLFVKHFFRNQEKKITDA